MSATSRDMKPKHWNQYPKGKVLHRDRECARRRRQIAAGQIRVGFVPRRRLLTRPGTTPAMPPDGRAH